MTHKIQIVVDDAFNNTIKTGAKKMGLSVSSFARLVLMNVLQHGNKKLLDQAMRDIQLNAIEGVTLAQFNRQLEDLDD